MARLHPFTIDCRSGLKFRTRQRGASNKITGWHDPAGNLYVFARFLFNIGPKAHWVPSPGLLIILEAWSGWQSKNLQIATFTSKNNISQLVQFSFCMLLLGSWWYSQVPYVWVPIWFPWFTFWIIPGHWAVLESRSFMVIPITESALIQTFYAQLFCWTNGIPIILAHCGITSV